MVFIAPSLLSANFTILGEEVKNLTSAGADYLHIDVMDGHFVPNLTFGANIIKQIRPLTPLIFDVHLMVDNPQNYIKPFAEAGANVISFHVESHNHPIRLLAEIKSYNIKAGIAINPATPINTLEYLIPYLDSILIMSVNPGFGGQEFIPSTINKIQALKNTYLKGKSNILLGVDGGISAKNSKQLIVAGADILVAGSSIFIDSNYKENINKLK